MGWSFIWVNQNLLVMNRNAILLIEQISLLSCKIIKLWYINCNVNVCVMKRAVYTNSCSAPHMCSYHTMVTIGCCKDMYITCHGMLKYNDLPNYKNVFYVNFYIYLVYKFSRKWFKLHLLLSIYCILYLTESFCKYYIKTEDI